MLVVLWPALVMDEVGSYFLSHKHSTSVPRDLYYKAAGFGGELAAVDVFAEDGGGFLSEVT